ncbi:MAG: hypothetical protein ABIJ09_05290 [Pseudomonadota bacterium]
MRCPRCVTTFLLCGLALFAGACIDGGECQDQVDLCDEHHAQRCAPDQDALQTCLVNEHGCMVWSITAFCSDHEQCSDSAGSPLCECQHGCAAPADTRCEGPRIHMCLVDEFGCLFESPLTNCAASNQVCTADADGARCEGSCTDNCSVPGARRCDARVVQSCVQDAEGCRTWQAETDCSTLAQFCHDEAGSVSCQAGCESECGVLNSTRCQGLQIQQCTLTGGGCKLWVNGPDCAQSQQVCDDGMQPAKCVAACSDQCSSEGAKRCQGTLIETCARTGYGCLGWEPGVDCASTSQQCSSAGGSVACSDLGVGSPLCFGCTAHTQCEGYSGQYGGVFCQPLHEGSTAYYCLQDCTNDAGLCQPGESCDAAGNCIPVNGCGGNECSQANPTGTCPAGLECQGGTCVRVGGGTGPIGSACAQGSDCSDAGAQCYPFVSNGQETGFVDGYCIQFGCDSAACPGGSSCVQVGDTSYACLDSCLSGADCRPGYDCLRAGDGVAVCYPYCETSSDCGQGLACVDNTCVSACTASSCPSGNLCVDGRCVVDVGQGPGTNTRFPLGTLGSTCPQLPPLQCTAGAAACNAIEFFAPVLGPGYDNYPLNGETASNQYRSYLRHDAQMMIKYAAAYVDCLARDWSAGNGGAIGLGDMSEQNGAIPGTSVNSPGHPTGTHTNGFDIDMGYFQVNTADNKLRAVCDHVQNGQDAYHCVSAPYLLDPWRTALYIGALFEHPSLRIIGVDGKVGPLVRSAITQLCTGGWLSNYACSRTARMTYEETDEGRGWFQFHHHHFHVSFAQPSYNLAGKIDDCLVPGCDEAALHEWLGRQGVGKVALRASALERELLQCLPQ